MKKYKVKSGNTLRTIAKKFYGDPTKFLLIAKKNNISNPNKIEVGAMLVIPDDVINPEEIIAIATETDDIPSEKKFSGLLKFHRAFPGSVRWKLTEDGVQIEGSGVERTAGLPKTITKIWESRSKEINKWAKHFDVPCVLIIATIATESSNNANARRQEPGFISDEATPHRVSVGLMQTLISTAIATLEHSSINAGWLGNPSNSIQAGTSYIAEQFPKTNFDPPKVACAYNAGGIYENKSANNRWRMRQYPIGTSEHCDRFIKFFNDAVFVLKDHAVKAKVAYERYWE